MSDKRSKQTKVQYFGSQIPGLGDRPTNEQTGVWWTQLDYSNGLAEWRCPTCKKYRFGLSIWWAKFRYCFHERFCGGEIECPIV